MLSFSLSLLVLLLFLFLFVRREQSNFQLIVITHDETFVDEIGKRAHAEYYYRVYKDHAQHSRIRKQVHSHDMTRHSEKRRNED